MLRSLAIMFAPLVVVAAVVPAPPQAPATYRLVSIGPDTVPLVLRNQQGQALLTIVRETLTMGPGDRVVRVTTMHVDAYDRFPCDLLKELRAREKSGATGAAPATPPARTDTTAAECAAFRTGTDSVTGTVGTEGGRRIVTWAPAPAGRAARTETRAAIEQKGDVLELRPEAQPGDSVPVVALRYRRAR